MTSSPRALRPPSARVALVALLGLLATALLWRAGELGTEHQSRVSDTTVYREAAASLTAGRSPYLPDSIGPTGLHYLYPPTFLLLTAPVLQLPTTSAYWVWIGLQLLAIAGFGHVLFRVAARASDDPIPTALLATGLLLAPIWRELEDGQINAMVLLCLAGGWSQVAARRPISGGALLALAAHLKVLPVVALLVLVAQRRVRGAAWMGLWLVAWVPLAAAIAWLSGSLPANGPTALDLWSDWWTRLVEPVSTNTPAWLLREFWSWNHSLPASLHRLFDPAAAARYGPGEAMLVLPRPTIRLLAWTIAGCLLLRALAIASETGRRSPAHSWASLGLALLATQLGHAQTWTHHLLSCGLFVPLLALGSRATAFGWPRLTRLGVGTYVALFTLPAAWVLLDRPSGSAVFIAILETGRIGLPTLALLLLSFGIVALAAATESSLAGTPRRHDRRDDVESPDRPRVSLVVPARNEARRLEPMLRRATRVGEALGGAWELLVVDDGSIDATSDVCRAIGPSQLRVLRLDRPSGKGAAIRAGLLAARGHHVVFADADDAAELERLPAMLARLDAGADLVIGTRVRTRAPSEDSPGAASRVERLPGRRILSRGLVGIARITLGLRWTDPQCGFKALRGSVAQDLARRGFLDGFAFDLELLYLARCDSLRCEEVAVGWVDRPGSKVRPAVDVPGFLRDILRIRFHAWRGDYAAPARDHRSASRAIDAASSPRGATGIDAQDRAAHPSSRSSERRRAPSTS
ncbi:MAG: glycosyltransferase [Myxococcales bacterium]|nr:glycosyltransferase [Myxococcales bacterium]